MQLLNTLEVVVNPERQHTRDGEHNAPLQVANPSSLLDREQVRVPICPVEIPSDEVLYQDPLKAETSYYLPRYKIVLEEVSGEPRYRVEMTESGQAWVLTVFVHPYIPESLIPMANAASALSHTLTATLKYTKSGQPLVKPFDEIEDHDAGKRLVMNLNDIEQRDDVFTALSTHEFSTSLVVERRIEVAIPVELDVPVKPPSRASASVILTKLGDKIGAIKAVRLWTGADLRKSKALIDQPLPATLISGLPIDRAAAFAKALNSAGSVAVVRGSSSNQHPKPEVDKVDLWLFHAGTNTSKVLIVMEKFGGMPPLKGKVLLSKPMPVKLFSSLTIEQARKLVAHLTNVGAKVDIKVSPRIERTVSAQALRVIRPHLEFLGTDKDKVGTTEFTRYKLSVKNASDIPDELFVASPNLPPCGRNTNSSRTWVDILNQDGKRLYGYCALSKAASLSQLSFGVKDRAVIPDFVQIVLNDRLTKTIYKSNSVSTKDLPTAKETKFRVTQSTCKQDVAPTPFHFDSRLHSYIYKFLGDQSGVELIRHELQYNDQPHSYYVDANQRHIVYYFPDQFKIARWDRPPFSPKVSVQINSREDDTGISDVIMSYLSAPVTDRQRLKQAATIFTATLDSEGPVLDLQPYPVVDYSFHVSHPIATGVRSVEQDVSSNAFYQGIHNTLLMELPDFVQCFAALTGQTAAPFRGTVSVTVDEDEKVELPFEADFSDLAGKLFDHAVLAQDDANVSLTLINSIESSLNIRELSVELERDGVSTDTILTANPSLPSLLAPGENITLDLTPSTSLEGSKPLKALLDTSAIDVVLDDDAVFNSILNRATTEYFRTITVKVVDTVFQAFEGRESEQVRAIIVNIEGSQGTDSIELDIDTLEGSARVQYSVDDLVLRHETSVSYRYWYQVARVNGLAEVYDVRVGRDEKLFLDVNHLIEGRRE